MLSLKLDLLQTLSLAAVLYFAGLQLRQRIGWLDRLNIPAAVVGGLIFALLVLVGRDRFLSVQLDTSAQSLLSVAFFSTIGMGASLALLRVGGIQVVIFLVFATVFCFVQNFLGMAIARGFGENPLLGVMAGSVTLVGGPATGLAFAPMLEQAGLVGAGTLALTSATFGIVCGGLTGTPIGTWLIRRFGLTPSVPPGTPASEEAEDVLKPHTLVVETDREDAPLIMTMIVLAAAMGLGSILSRWFEARELTLPAYIGAMIVASIFRNLDDVTGWFKIDPAAMDFVGGFALNIFLVVALMDLKLWQLAGQALPLFVILAAQVVVIALFALTVSFRLMGRDYDSAVMASGFIGFALGTTANAVANMRALVTRYGPAPRAFLVVPLVGAFFIDFANAIIITFFVNWLR
ncbi:MAG TPA: sodium/glutamate symporter [Gemmatimonadales bacterium]|jgi:ESS family glutamate:Na+ symporter|nr:sodium/glutamate symporter [Gemmatimonadales bacterium]